MADLITIIYNASDENAPITGFLNTQIEQTGKYETVIKNQAEYESVSFENELLGIGASDKPEIFIGNVNPNLNEKVKWVYNEYGMKYGWNGKQAVLLVEKRKWTEAELAELTRVLSQSQEIKPKSGIKDQIDKISGKVNKLPLGLKIAGAVAGGAVFGVAAAAVAGSALLINNKINNDKLLESQQKYLANKFVTMSIADFIGQSA